MPPKFLILFLAAQLLLVVIISTKVSSTTDHEELEIIKVPTPTPAPIVQIPVKAPTPVPTLPPVNPSSPPPTVVPPLLPVKSKADCVPLCNGRCAVHSRKNVCGRACLTCCYRCKCVPPGTSGNREMCGKCYTDMTTHGNLLKCP